MFFLTQTNVSGLSTNYIVSGPQILCPTNHQMVHPELELPLNNNKPNPRSFWETQDHDRHKSLEDDAQTGKTKSILSLPENEPEVLMLCSR